MGSAVETRAGSSQIAAHGAAAVTPPRAVRLEDDGLPGRRQVLRMPLKHGGVALTAVEEARVEACDEPAALDAWIVRAATARSAADVFTS